MSALQQCGGRRDQGAVVRWERRRGRNVSRVWDAGWLQVQGRPAGMGPSTLQMACPCRPAPSERAPDVVRAWPASQTAAAAPDLRHNVRLHVSVVVLARPHKPAAGLQPLRRSMGGWSWQQNGGWTGERRSCTPEQAPCAGTMLREALVTGVPGWRCVAWPGGAPKPSVHMAARPLAAWAAEPVG